MVVYMARACVICTALLLCAQAWAHHSSASTYFRDKTVTVEGKVVEFLYRNPHSVVRVEADGVTWAGDWSSAGQLSRQGIDADTLRPGDHVIVTGNPGRNAADHRLRMVTLTRPSDGWKWSDVLQ